MTTQELDLTLIQIQQLEESIIIKLQTHIRALIGKWALSVIATVAISSYIASATWSNLQSRVSNVEQLSKVATSDIDVLKKQSNVINNKLTEISTDMKWIKGKLSK